MGGSFALPREKAKCSQRTRIEPIGDNRVGFRCIVIPRQEAFYDVPTTRVRWSTLAGRIFLSLFALVAIEVPAKAQVGGIVIEVQGPWWLGSDSSPLLLGQAVPVGGTVHFKRVARDDSGRIVIIDPYGAIMGIRECLPPSCFPEPLVIPQSHDNTLYDAIEGFIGVVANALFSGSPPKHIATLSRSANGLREGILWSEGSIVVLDDVLVSKGPADDTDAPDAVLHLESLEGLNAPGAFSAVLVRGRWSVTPAEGVYRFTAVQISWAEQRRLLKTREKASPKGCSGDQVAALDKIEIMLLSQLGLHSRQ